MGFREPSHKKTPCRLARNGMGAGIVLLERLESGASPHVAVCSPLRSIGPSCVSEFLLGSEILSHCIFGLKKTLQNLIWLD